MPHGAPDWGKYRRDSVTFPVEDLAELAVRLGSSNYFDRRGDVVFTETFEHGSEMWVLDGDGTDNDQRISPESFRSGGYALKLKTGSSSGDYARAYNYVTHPGGRRLGVELSFTVDAFTRLVDFEFIIHDGTTMYKPRLRVNVSTDTLQYRDRKGRYQDLDTNIKTHSHRRHFNTIKFVIDLDTSAYVRAILNSREYPLPGILVETEPDTSAGVLTVYIWVETGANHTSTTYVDDIIITQDEP